MFVDITKEMVAAGVGAYLLCDPKWDNVEHIVCVVFEEMWKAKVQSENAKK